MKKRPGFFEVFPHSLSPQVDDRNYLSFLMISFWKEYDNHNDMITIHDNHEWKIVNTLKSCQMNEDIKKSYYSKSPRQIQESIFSIWYVLNCTNINHRISEPLKPGDHILVAYQFKQLLTIQINGHSKLTGICRIFKGFINSFLSTTFFSICNKKNFSGVQVHKNPETTIMDWEWISWNQEKIDRVLSNWINYKLSFSYLRLRNQNQFTEFSNYYKFFSILHRFPAKVSGMKNYSVILECLVQQVSRQLK